MQIKYNITDGGPYRIALCDDKNFFLEDTSQKIKKALAQNNIAFTIEPFTQPDLLIEILKDNPRAFDIIFLDVVMEKNNGIEVARTLRNMGVDAFIIFVSNSRYFAIKGYEVDAFRYLIKPVNIDELTDALLQCHNILYSKRKNQLVFSVGTQIQRILYEDITHVEVRNRGTLIYTKDERTHTPYKISELDTMAKQSLLRRCHQSFMVNLAFVEQIKRYEARLVTGNIVPISKTYFQTIRNDFMAHINRS